MKLMFAVLYVSLSDGPYTLFSYIYLYEVSLSMFPFVVRRWRSQQVEMTGYQHHVSRRH